MIDESAPDEAKFVNRRHRSPAAAKAAVKQKVTPTKRASIKPRANKKPQFVPVGTTIDLTLNETAAPKRPYAVDRTWFTRPRIIKIALVVLAVVMVPIIVGEVVAAQYTQAIRTAQRELVVVANESKLVQKKPTVSADQVRQQANKVDGIATRMCRGGFMDNMASLYPRAARAHRDCVAGRSGYAALASGLYGLETETRYLERLQAVLQPAVALSSGNEAVIEAQLKAWQDSADKVKKVSPPEKMKPAHEQLAIKVAAIVDGWSQLKTANDSQDLAKYTEVKVSLEANYAGVRDAAPLLREQIIRQQQAVTASYSKLKQR
ncbi:MAG TPA: hypothetical protein VF597_04255 [Candidatus Saccharimonadales bacterium]|jgi:hypothetical protein